MSNIHELPINPKPHFREEAYKFLKVWEFLKETDVEHVDNPHTVAILLSAIRAIRDESRTYLHCKKSIDDYT